METRISSTGMISSTANSSSVDSIDNTSTSTSSSTSIGQEKVEVNNERTYSETELKKGIEAMNKFLEASSSSVKFTLHNKLHEYYVQIVNDKTNEVIREIPSKRLMDSVAQMFETIGLIIDKKM